tara:strand:- start:1410 stop:2678 length:1269 start_codon:yes stop_codon:yes gene_type:complete
MSTVNKVSEARKIKEEPKNHSYPFNLASIPYASFMRIYKYSYDEGMKNVGANQNDAIGSIQNSGLLKNINDKLVDGAQWVYGDKTSGRALLNFDTDSEIISNYRNQLMNKKGEEYGGMSREQILDVPLSVDNGWGAGFTDTTLRELIDKKNEVKKFHQSGYKKAWCNLAMPNEFQFDYSANWNNTFKLGTMALAADDPQRAAIVLGSGATIGMLSSGMKGFLSKSDKDGGLGLGDIAGIASGAKAGAMKAGDFFGVNSNILDPTNIAGMAGLTPNENAIQFFKKMDFRQFDMNFEFAARNKDESQEIQKILQWFKEGMHPVSKDPLGSGTGVLLGFPDVWKLEPRFTPGKEDGDMVEGGADVPHPMMPQTKLCALTQIRVNTSPMGQFATVFDGSIPLITVTLRFNELTALTRSDFMDNTNY